MTAGPAYAIVGAAGGIGTALCHELAAAGARLFVGGRNEARLEELAVELRHRHAADVRGFPLDATVSAEVDLFFAKAAEAFGPVAGAVNLVGSILLKPAHLTTDFEFADTVATNLSTAFYVLRAAARAMMTTGGSVVLMSSVAARVGLTNHEAIAAAKAGIDGLVRAAAATYAPRNVRVNAVAPGLVRTPLSAKLTANELALKASTAIHPLGRIGEPRHVAALVAWLLDPRNDWVTGQVIGVDGGLGAARSK